MGGGSNKIYLKKAQVILNSAARWCTGLGRRTRTNQLMAKTGWLSIKEQVKISTLVFTWKLVHFGKPRRLLERMTLTQDLEIQVEIPRLKFSEQCLRWRAANLWNGIPGILRHITTIASFKRQIRRLVLSERTWDPGDL